MGQMLRIAVIQMKTGTSKEADLLRAESFAARAAASGADIAVLPEMFMCPYNTASFPLYAEYEDGMTVKCLSKIAAENGIYIVGGSIPERDAQGRIYNTSFVFDRAGRKIASHRKIHLFDIDIEGRQTFRESDTLTAGDRITVFETEYGRMGLCICYDIRFPEIFRIMADMGVKAVFCPASFNMTTGPMHWKLLFSARAVDTQAFMIGASPASDPGSGYVSYGHSIVCDPWGRVIAQAAMDETLLIADADLAQTDIVRAQIPVMRQRRPDIYICGPARGHGCAGEEQT